MPKAIKGLPPAGSLLTTAQAEQRHSVSRRHLHRLAAEGRLTKYYFGKRLRWDARELEAMLTRNRGDAA
jgi:hypothetical protein